MLLNLDIVFVLDLYLELSLLNKYYIRIFRIKRKI